MDAVFLLTVAVRVITLPTFYWKKIVLYLKVNLKMLLRHLEQNIRRRSNEMMKGKTSVCEKRDNPAHRSNAVLQAGGIWTGITSDKNCSIFTLNLRTMFD